MSNLERILKMVEKEPRNLKAIELALSGGAFSKEDLMRIAIMVERIDLTRPMQTHTDIGFMR